MRIYPAVSTRMASHDVYILEEAAKRVQQLKPVAE